MLAKASGCPPHQWQRRGDRAADRIPGSAAIRRLIPTAEVRLFGSRARGEAGPDSDVDLLITAPDAWLASRDRFALLADLWGAVAQPDLSVDRCSTPAARPPAWLSSPDPSFRRPSARGWCSMPSPEAERLLRVARRDLRMAGRLLDPEVEEASWGWALQQTLEKTLKTWLRHLGVKPPHSHNIARLLVLLEQAGVEVNQLLSLGAFTTFAEQGR